MPQTKKKPATRAKTSKTKPAAPAKKPLIRREVWAAALLLLAFIALLSFFRVEGFMINWYSWLTGSLVGAGSSLTPFALGAAGGLLLYKRKGKARLRVACIMLMPVLFGAVGHLLNDPAAYEFGLGGMGLLAQAGRAHVSGGLVAGALAIFLRAAISQVGAVILLVALMIVAAFLAFNANPKNLWLRIKSLRPLPEPEEEEPIGDLPGHPVANPPRGHKPGLRPAKTSGIDVALDESDVTVRTPDRGAESPISPPGVPTPAEAVRGMAQADKAERGPKSLSKDPTELIAPKFETNQAEIDLPGEVEAEAAPADAAAAAAADEIPVEVQIQQAMENPDPPAYLYPPVSLLKGGTGRPQGMEASTQACAARLIDTLQSFGIEATVVDITCGPTVTRYELQLQRGVKFSKVTGLSDDIALALGAVGVRVSTIPDKNAVGIEVPNEKQELVTARDIISSAQFKNSASKLSFAVGKDITGGLVVGDIAKMPHMLIAGTTGSGKSVCVNSILISLLYKATPEEVRLIMVDPKMIELGVYNGIPHLLIPVVTDPRKAAGALNWAVSEMMKRYKLFSEVGTRDLASYNQVMSQREGGETLPQIVIVIDELSDLMVAARNEVEEAIIRIAQMARAAGMHLIIATQRPSADVITGLMKTNIPSRIAFAVAQAIDSRIILDQMGAEKLLGKGDMLYAPLGAGKPQRIQGCFVTDREVEDVVSFIKQTGQADYDQEVMTHIEKQAENAPSGGGGGGMPDMDADDELLTAAIEIVVDSGQASVSMLQRRLKLGYSRAARLVDIMEERGIVGAFEGSKPRAVLISRDDWKEMMLRRSD